MDQFEIDQATKRAEQRQSRDPKAVAAHCDPDHGLVVAFSTGAKMAFPLAQLQGLTGATASDLAEIEITPSGYGLHFPKLDADLWVPALVEGVFGSRAWMAARLGAEGGKATSEAKAAAARANGRLGGRPAKRAAARKAKRPVQAKAATSARKPASTRLALAPSKKKPKSKTADRLAVIRARRRKAAAKRRPPKIRA
jgi:hypothetical protein